MRPLLFALLPVLLVGCSSGGELGKKDDQDLRNNFTRKLTPAEIKLLQSSKPPAASGTAAPPK